jgi:hypothetical protein
MLPSAHVDQVYGCLGVKLVEDPESPSGWRVVVRNAPATSPASIEEVLLWGMLNCMVCRHWMDHGRTEYATHLGCSQVHS